ncbi:MAG TPA: ATP-binding protein [Gemmatimonadaceae bacterium]|nr:ATP-binding protein [Gemmatimonadaceae bacterium]
MAVQVIERNQEAETLPVVLLTPTGQDGSVAQRVLVGSGFQPRICTDMKAVCELLEGERIGVLVLAEEALRGGAREELMAALEAQPPWSDVPIVVLTGEEALSGMLRPALSGMAVKGNITLLERPVRVATLTTVIRSGLRARQRQLDVKAHLEEKEESEEQLRDSEARLRVAVDSERTARKEAEEANAAKSKFLATMSHELRTPLNAIAGYAQLLTLGVRGPITEAQKEDIERINRSQRHLLSLINDILNFAKIEAGHVDIAATPIKIGDIIESLKEFVDPQLRAKDLQFTIASDIPEAEARGDPDKVRQILINLLSNAIKFTPEGGHIALECEENDKMICIIVRDDGAGIPADKLDAIFEPFVQVTRDYASPQQGTGLGLSISRDLARRMGGDLTVESEYGRGSKFVLSLPRA